jgi:hypothetical protein
MTRSKHSKILGSAFARRTMLRGPLVQMARTDRLSWRAALAEGRQWVTAAYISRPAIDSFGSNWAYRLDQADDRVGRIAAVPNLPMSRDPYARQGSRVSADVEILSLSPDFGHHPRPRDRRMGSGVTDDDGST